MDKLWTEAAWEVFLSLQKDKKLLKKINSVLKDIDRNEYDGIGKPEPLKDNLSGYWSRRIDEYNRIVYRIVEENGKKHIEILQCGGHYSNQVPEFIVNITSIHQKLNSPLYKPLQTFFIDFIKHSVYAKTDFFNNFCCHLGALCVNIDVG